MHDGSGLIDVKNADAEAVEPAERMNTLMDASILAGNFPIVATPFSDDDELDLDSTRALLDYLIAQGVHGLVILANASESFALGDVERDQLTRLTIQHVAGRVPVVVTVSHYSTRIAVRRSIEAEQLGAGAIMALPPFYGSWSPNLDGTFEHFRQIAGAVRLPVIIQDHPVSGVVMPAPFLTRLATELETIQYFKIETPDAPGKIAGVLQSAGTSVTGIFGGMNGVLLLQELDAGACGTMPSSSLPGVFSQVCEAFRSGQRDNAVALFNRYLPLINFEIRLGGRNAAKEILASQGVIQSARVRSPGPNRLDDRTRLALLALLRDVSS